MATLFAASAVLSATTAGAASTATTSPAHPRPLIKPHFPPPKPLSTTLAATAAAASLLLSSPSPSLADSPTFHLYYGTAASAANYGGYGGNESKKDSAEYIYEVPDGWKERLISKVEKGTNGTDSEFYNPKKRAERVYLTFLPGFPALAPVDAVLSNLALSDVDLQDQITGAEAVRSEERRDDKGQLYYAYEIEGAGAHSLVSVTCARTKLYAHFVSAPNPEWNRDQDTLRRLHESFKTIDPAPSS
ncbi:thylakoid lumenal 19 kDa protein, chloroplastic [Cocos nucifera]|uniref:Thylakoid lumenal 19 kDa protein, chloroplastic n=1 Tax=Cocos nucifera TaxID=13894 RepID=A0A8K0MUX1_COCNU|nr:thylakoid lumenal 19 kDa protein, chloroplastic [Cocos nucifera]